MEKIKDHPLEKTKNEEINPDPSLNRVDFGCTLLIGRSGSGKTYYVKHILNNIKKNNKNKNKVKIYTINVNNREYIDVFQKKITPIELTQIKEIKRNSYVIIEDVISMSNKENTLLRSLVNYYCHHYFLKIFIITHSIYKNGIYSLLGFFHYIVFTGVKSNLPVLRFTLNYYKLENNDLQTMLTKFKEKSVLNEHTYFIFDTKNMIFFSQLKNEFVNLMTKNDHSTDIKKISLTEFQIRFDKFVEDFDEKSKASAIFSIIINCLPTNLIRLHDLTFSFKSSKNSQYVRVSIVDYISCLLSYSEAPPTEIKCLHNYLKGSCCIPKLFIKNKQLK